MYTKLKTALNRILKFLKLNLVVSILVLGGINLLSSISFAYDGDVDFNAPYLTVDPETGKLVTIDPKTQTKTPHGVSDDTFAQVTPATDDTSTSQSDVMAQTSSSQLLIEDEDEVASGSNIIILIGLVVVLIAFTSILLSNRNKQTAKPEQS